MVRFKKINFMSFVFFLTSIFNVFYPAMSFAAKVNVKTELSVKTAEVGDRVILSVSITSSDGQVNIDNKTQSPRVKGLDFLNRSQSSSSNMRFSGGQKTISFTKTLNLFFTPTIAGRIRIPPFTIFVNGTPVRTEPVILEVVKELTASQRKVKKNRRGFSIFGNDDEEDIINRFFRGFRSDDKVEKPEFFVDAEVENLTPYEGEQFLVKWYVYTNGALSQFDTLEFPTLEGFWKEDVEFAQNFRWQRAEKDGKAYRRALMTSYALTPYKAGKLKIDSFDLRATVSATSFGFGKPKVFRFKSREYDIDVMPLPEPKPEFFNGGVGDFSIELDTFPSIARVAEAFSVKIRIKGDESNVKFLENIKLDLGDNFQLYEQKEDVKFFPNSVSYIKRISFLIIPVKEGMFALPDLRLNFFETETSQYKSEYVQFPILKVVPNASGKSMPTDVILKAENDNKAISEGDHKFVFINNKSILATIISPSYLLTIYPFLIILIGLLLYSLLLVMKQASERSFIEVLEAESLEVKQFLDEKDYKKALDKMINLVSYGVGAMSGKRYGVEQTLKDSLDMLPTSLSDYKSEVLKLNENLQDIRFAKVGTQNKSKVEACYDEFLKFKLKVVDYLKKD